MYVAEASDQNENREAGESTRIQIRVDSPASRFLVYHSEALPILVWHARAGLPLVAHPALEWWM
jgi:hypothetical protein